MMNKMNENGESEAESPTTFVHTRENLVGLASEAFQIKLLLCVIVLILCLLLFK